MDLIEQSLLKEISDLDGIFSDAFNIRINGKLDSRKISENVNIVTKEDKSGIDIIVKDGTVNERVDIPVLLTESGLEETVYNDFYIGENCDITIVAGCGIHNCGSKKSEHDGIHSFHIGKNSKLKYIEKHYGEGNGNGEKILNPTTLIDIDEGGYMEMETAQIKGVDSTYRKTEATLSKKAKLIIREKIMTHGKQSAITDFKVDLNGEGSATHVISRSVATENSHQKYISKVNGNNKCNGHTECDAIIMDNASVVAVPEISANDTDASLIHEAAIGKIAGEQLIKLMTLGLSEKEAAEQIINGFLK